MDRVDQEHRPHALTFRKALESQLSASETELLLSTFKVGDEKAMLKELPRLTAIVVGSGIRKAVFEDEIGTFDIEEGITFGPFKLTQVNVGSVLVFFADKPIFLTIRGRLEEVLFTSSSTPPIEDSPKVNDCDGKPLANKVACSKGEALTHQSWNIQPPPDFWMGHGGWSGH